MCDGANARKTSRYSCFLQIQSLDELYDFELMKETAHNHGWSAHVRCRLPSMSN